MASRQNYSSSPMVNNNNSQSTTTTTTTNVKDKSNHSIKLDTSKLKHDKSGTSASSGHMSSNTIINNMSNKRKGTSFQITSVSVSSANAKQRNSTDNNGDDSADDLDDSHTDDNISRITDYETPSISETFSGEDVFFAQQNAFGTAPVIPTSSQYGLAIVGPDLGCGNGTNLTDVHVSVTDVGTINIMGPISSKQDVDHKNERFKVVKIESTEPFKRGRWMCMDYLDHTTLQDDGIDGKENNSEGGGENSNATKDDESMNSNNETTATGPKVLIVNNGEVVISDNEELDHEVNKINSTSKDIITAHQVTSHPQTMTSIPTFIDHSPNNNSQATVVAQSFPLGQIEKIITQDKQLTLNLHDNLSNERHTASIAQQNEKILTQLQSLTENINNTNVISSNTSQQQQSTHHAQTMTQEMIHSIMHQEQQQQQQQQMHNFHQGATLPTNILMQNIEHPHSQQSQQSQLNSPNSSNALPIQQPIPTQNNNININITSSENPENEFNNSNSNNNNVNSNQDPLTSQSQIATGDRIQSESDNQQQQTGSLVTNENIINSNNSSSTNNNNNSDNNNDGAAQQNVSSPLSSVTEGGAVGSVNDSNENANSATVAGGTDADGQVTSEDTERHKLCNMSHNNNNNNKKTDNKIEHRLHYLPHQHIKDKQRMIEHTVKKRIDINGILTIRSGTKNERNSSEKKIFSQFKEMSVKDAEHDKINIVTKNLVGNIISKSNINNANLLLFGQYSTTKSTKSQKSVEKTCIGCTPGGLSTTALNMNLTTISPLCTNVGCIGTSCNRDANSSSRLSRSASPALGSTSDNASASGTSAVAIDNKIEQAMDLVKSHLMFAVREEVEVLKEKIAELMDRINQLEVENTILKANASQETLSQLTIVTPQPQQQQQQQQQSASPVVSQNPPSQPQQQLSTPSQPSQTTQTSPNTQNQTPS